MTKNNLTIQEVREQKEYALNAIKVSIVKENGVVEQLDNSYVQKYHQGLSPYVEWKRDQIKKTGQDD